MFLSGDDPFHKTADGEHTFHLFTFHDREMANAAGGHDADNLLADLSIVQEFLFFPQPRKQITVTTWK
jgi:hypothetical protein